MVISTPYHIITANLANDHVMLVDGHEKNLKYETEFGKIHTFFLKTGLDWIAMD